MGMRDFARANLRASRATVLGQWKLKPYFSQGWLVGVETGVIVSFKGWTSKQASILLVSEEMAS
jgi:hypothetical protein